MRWCGCVLAAVVAVGVVVGGVNGAGAANPQSAVRNPQSLERDYFVGPVAFNLVNVNDAFWSPRLLTNQTVTIPYCFKMCDEETGRIRNFEKAAGLKEGKHQGIYFDDSDVYKVMEGAAYSLQVHPDMMLRLYLDKLIAIMAKAQWEDGYLYTFYSLPQRQPEKRWTNEKDMHEQYCMGHLFEAAVAHYQVTGDKAFLDIATKCADYLCSVFGPGKRTDPPGHQEIEIGLCRLYRVTGDGKYLDLAKFLLDSRGRKGNRGPDGNGDIYGEYAQDHIPVVEQKEATGHSVRAAYMYTGMADVAALTGNTEYITAIESIWHDVVGTKMYVTGGIGASGGNEGFSGKYELPNLTAYCETCAAFANIFWNHRMFLMQGDAKYIDVLERSLYNAALSGIGMKGDRFFYPNVLESNGSERSPWFDCACCPSNVARFVPSVPGCAYACRGNNLYVNLFMGSDVTLAVGGNKVKLSQQTEYPWSGKVAIAVEPETSGTFTVCVRIPGWARNEAVPSDLYTFLTPVNDKPTLKVNGKTVSPSIEKGYARIERQWQKGDTIELDLPMPVRRVIAHQAVKADLGKVALQRGPLVYCLEGPDNDGKVLNMVIADDAKFRSEHRSDLLGGVTVITGKARLAKRTGSGEVVSVGTKAFTAIPYYAWAHRGRAQMTVWPARTLRSAKADPADTPASTATVTASFVHASLAAINDQVVPENSADASGRQLDFWPHKGTTEWIQFEWKDKRNVSGVKVYWFDDTGRGECHLPQSWKVLYRDAAGAFKPVNNASPFCIIKDTFNKVPFELVKTDAIRIEVVLQKDWSAGVQEVVIE